MTETNEPNNRREKSRSQRRREARTFARNEKKVEIRNCSNLLPGDLILTSRSILSIYAVRSFFEVHSPNLVNGRQVFLPKKLPAFLVISLEKHKRERNRREGDAWRAIEPMITLKLLPVLKRKEGLTTNPLRDGFLTLKLYNDTQFLCMRRTVSPTVE